MRIELDHLLWGVTDVGAGGRDIAAATRVEPVVGGPHPGFGTCNQLLSLGAQYLEVIGPDPEQSRDGTLGGVFEALAEPKLFAFALSCDDLGAAIASAKAVGLEAHDPIDMSRTRPDGVTLYWSILRFSHPDWGERFPFLIDWKDTPHPAHSTPQGCSLASLEAFDPEPDALRAVYEALQIKVPVSRAPRHGYLARIKTPNGPVALP